MATFNSVTFSPLTERDREPQPEAKAAVSVRHIPGGDATYLDYGGREAPRFKFRCSFADATALANLKAQIGQSGTLAVGSDSYSAVLLGIEDVVKFPAGFYFASPEFLLST